MNLILIILFIKICLLNASYRSYYEEQECERPKEYFLKLLWTPTLFLEQNKGPYAYKEHFHYTYRVMNQQRKQWNKLRLFDIFTINSFFAAPPSFCSHKAIFNNNSITLQQRQDLRIYWPLFKDYDEQDLITPNDNQYLPTSTFRDDKDEVEFWRNQYEENCPCPYLGRTITNKHLIDSYPRLEQLECYNFLENLLLHLYEGYFESLIDIVQYVYDYVTFKREIDTNFFRDFFAIIDQNSYFDFALMETKKFNLHLNLTRFYEVGTFRTIHQESKSYTEFQKYLSIFSSPRYKYKVRIVCSDLRNEYIKYVYVCYDRNLKVKNCNPNENINCNDTIKLPTYKLEKKVQVEERIRDEEEEELVRLGRRIVASSDED